MKRNFFLKHASHLAKKYSGKYVVVVDDKIVATGRGRLEAYKKISKKLTPHQSFGIYYFPKPEELLTALWTFLT